jgi:FkbM family methyltransferase
MPITQEDHFDYTITEWCKEPFTILLETIFKNENNINFIDIGANVGGVIESLNKLNYIHKISNIICFEPDNDNFNFLSNVCENIKKTNNIDIKCHNIGIFYGKTQAQVCGVGDNNIGGYFIDDENTNKVRNYNIVQYNNKTFYLDVIENYINYDIDVVKMDIEGSEINVLENSTILKNSKYIILEWHFEIDKFYDFLKKHLENFEIIYDCKNTNYLLKNKNRL